LKCFFCLWRIMGNLWKNFKCFICLEKKNVVCLTCTKTSGGVTFRWCDFVMATKKCCMASHIFLDCVTVIQHDNHINANLHLVWFKILMKNVDKPYLWRSKIKSLNFCSKKNEINGQLFYLSEKVWICDKAIYFALLFCVVNNIF